MSEVIIHSTSTIEAETKGGLKKYWRGDVVEKDGKYYTRAVYWQDKKDGTSSEVQESALYEVGPTNVGRSNERSGKDQAIFNIKSDYQKQTDKGYHLPGQGSTNLTLPMLAHEYSKRKHSLGESICVQPKLDGCRALQRDKIFWSRQGKLLIDEVTKHMQIETGGVILDGELMLPKPYTFQDTMSAVKKFREDSTKLQYWVFDLVAPNLPFFQRYQYLKGFVAKSPNLILVPTYIVSNEEDIMKAHAKFCTEGYEGTIIRDCNAKYVIGHRSEFLLKYKDFVDDEYEIVDVIDGLGKEAGCAIFACVTKEGKRFECRPAGTVEYRQEIFNNKNNYIGKSLTVKYQNLTDDGIPRFPIAVGVRDYE